MAGVRSRTVFAFSPWIILIVALFCTTTARAGIGFQAISPEELKMTSEPKAPGAPAIILYRQLDRDDSRRNRYDKDSNWNTYYRDDRDVPQIEDNYFRIKILTEEGRKYADVEIPMPFRNTSDRSADVFGVKARTIRPDGSVINFDGKVLEKTIVKAKGQKYLAKTFAIPGVEVGSIIEYAYTMKMLDRSYVHGSHWTISNDLFTKNARFSLKVYRGAFSEGTLRWTWPGVQTPPKLDLDDFVRLEVSDIPAFQTEDYMPPQEEMRARVDFFYTEDAPDKDVASFWKRVGKRLNSNVDMFIGKPDAMRQAVSQIVSPKDSPEEKARKLYARVQQLRNTSYEVHKTEEEKKRDDEKDLSTAEGVWKHGYGNGVQLTWLYLALAKAAGLEAYGVEVADRSNYFLDPKVMNSSKLDANAVLLRLNGQDVYCDPGAAFTPFGLLPWNETGVMGLRLDKDGGSWISTTLPESTVSRIERKANLKLSAETGALEGKLTITYTGLEALRLRMEERNEDEEARKKLLEDEVKATIPVASEVELVTQPEWKSSTLPLVAGFKLKVPGWAIITGRRAMLTGGLFSGTEKHVFDHAERKHPIYYHYPSSKMDDITIELPDGWHATSLPPETNRDQQSFAYSSKVVNEKGSLHLTRKLSLDILLLETKYYPTLQNFYRMVRTSDEQQIVLQPDTATASR